MREIPYEYENFSSFWLSVNNESLLIVMLSYPSPMQKIIPIQRNFRRYQRSILGSVVLIIAFIAAILIAHEANRTVLLWSAAHELSAGAVIEASDLKVARALLPGNSERYFSSQAELIGTIVNQHIGEGELIPTTALLDSTIEVDCRYVPLEIASHDLPANVERGSIVDIYALAKNSQSSLSVDNSELIAVATTVISVDRSGDLSGSVGVVVNLRTHNVLPVISKISDHRILLISHV